MNTVTILDFFKQNVSEERNIYVTKAFYVFEEYNRKVIYSKLNDIIMEDQLTTTDYKLESANELLLIELRTILKSLGIYANDLSQLPELVSLLETIDLIEQLDNLESISNIVNIDDDPEIILIELAKELTNADKLKLLDQLDYVTDSFIKIIRNYVSINVVKENDDDLKTTNKLLTVYFKTYGSDNLVAKLYKDGVPLNQPIDTYITLLDEVEFKDDRELSEVLLGLFIYSGEKLDSILTKYKEMSEELIGDLNTITSVEIKLSKLINDFVMRLNIYEKTRIS